MWTTNTFEARPRRHIIVARRPWYLHLKPAFVTILTSVVLTQATVVALNYKNIATQAKNHAIQKILNGKTQAEGDGQGRLVTFWKRTDLMRRAHAELLYKNGAGDIVALNVYMEGQKQKPEVHIFKRPTRNGQQGLWQPYDAAAPSKAPSSGCIL